jgi:hypothetical protein
MALFHSSKRDKTADVLTNSTRHEMALFYSSKRDKTAEVLINKQYG